MDALYLLLFTVAMQGINRETHVQIKACDSRFRFYTRTMPSKNAKSPMKEHWSTSSRLIRLGHSIGHLVSTVDVDINKANHHAGVHVYSA